MTGGVGVGVDDGGGDDTTTAGAMTSVNVFDADVPAVAVTVTLKLPDAAGVPVMVAPEIESPLGSPLAVHVAVPVPPVALREAL